MSGEGEPRSAGGSFDPRLEPVVASFLQRHRRGERPSIEEYAREHPEFSESIRRLFPALCVLEEISQPAGTAPSPDPATGAIDSEALPPRLGEYRILRELGRGGMGVVYEAEQESLGRRVALKVLSSSTWSSARYRDRFRREASAAAHLEHPHIVPIYGFGEDGGVSYYAMQRIHGAGLDDVLAELRSLCAAEESPAGRPADAGAASGNRALSSSLALGLLGGRYHAAPAGSGAAEKGAAERGQPGTGVPETPLPACAREARPPAGETAQALSPAYFREVARLGREAASALAFAHEKGVLHRDIKPANLLLDESGQVRVADFGLARVEGLEELTQSGEVLGTLRYMAPEQLEGMPDARSDLYSLGLTLYELLTLRPAFRGERGVLVQKILGELPPRPRAVEPRIPPQLDDLVWTAIQKDPARRYQSARELAADLERFLGGLPLELPAPGAGAIAPAGWRRPLRVVLAATAVLAAAALLAMGLTGAWQREKESTALKEDTGRAAAVSVANAFEVAEYAAGPGPKYIRAADLDQDGSLDLTLADGISNDLCVFRNLGAGKFAAAMKHPLGTLPSALRVADLDGDGRLDAAAANRDSQDISILRNDGKGGFAALAPVALGDRLYALETADLDGDARVDLAAGMGAGRLLVLWNGTEEEAFKVSEGIDLGARILALAAADLDGDGSLDLAAGTQDRTKGVAVLLNRGRRAFAPAKRFDAGGMVLALLAADLDGDRRPDLAGCTSYTDAKGQLLVNYSVWILRSREGGDLEALETVVLDTPAQALAAGDLDGDGDVDLVAAGGPAGLAALRNDGAGRFPEIAALPATGRPSSVTLADLDGDRRLDIAMTNWATKSITVLLSREAIFSDR